MDKTLQIIDWNISYMNDWEKKTEFLFSKLNNDYCVILQEVGPWVAQCIREKYSKENYLVYSLDYRKPSKYDSGARRLGVMLIFSKTIKVIESGIIERNLFPDRTAWATIMCNNKKIKILDQDEFEKNGEKYNYSEKLKKVSQDSVKVICEMIKENHPYFSDDYNRNKLNKYMESYRNVLGNKNI